MASTLYRVVEGAIHLEAVKSGHSASSPTEVEKNVVVERVDQRARQQWDKTKCAELGISDHYSKVAVLMVHWAKNLDEDLKCWQEVEDLEEVFRTDFNFETKVITLDIHSQYRPQLQLDKAFTDFVYANDGPHQSNLLIVYYTGHGYTQVDNPDELFISGTENGENSQDTESFHPLANWTASERMLNDAWADTLVILDCCSASNIMKGVGERSRSYELMAATGKNKATPSGPKSYSAALIKSLKTLQQREEQPFTTYDLNQMIIRQRDWNTDSQLYTRRPNTRTRHIAFAPPTTPSPSHPLQPGNCAGYLDLRIAFQDHSTLKFDDVRKICSALCRLPQSVGLKIYDLEYLGFTPCKDSAEFKTLVRIFKTRFLFRKAMTRFKAKKKRKLQLDQFTDDARPPKRRQTAPHQPTSPVNTMSRSLSAQPPLPPSPSSRCATPLPELMG